MSGTAPATFGASPSRGERGCAGEERASPHGEAAASSELATWLEPIAGDAPGGPDARHEPEHERIRAEVEKLSSLRGAGVDWHLLQRDAQVLLQHKTKDLLIGVYLAFAWAKLEGLVGMTRGMRLLGSLLERYPQALQPRRPRARANALSWFAERAAELPADGGSGAETAGLRDAYAALLAAARAVLGEECPSLHELGRHVERAALSARDGSENAASGLPQGQSSGVLAPSTAARGAAPRATLRDALSERAEAGSNAANGSAAPAIGAASGAAPGAASAPPEVPSGGPAPGAAARAVSAAGIVPDAGPVVGTPAGRVVAAQAAAVPGAGAAPVLAPGVGAGSLAGSAAVAGPAPVAELAPVSAATPASAGSISLPGPIAAPVDVSAVPPFLSAAAVSLVEAARALFEADPAQARSFRLLRIGLWLELDTAPPAQGDGRTRMRAPEKRARDALAALVSAGRWEALLLQSEATLRASPLWLDLCWLSARALEALGETHGAAKAAVESESRALIRRLPQLLELRFLDGTPIASPEAAAWLRAGGSDQNAADDAGPPKALLSAFELALGSGDAGAARELERLLRAAPSARESFQWRLALARSLETSGKLGAAAALYLGLERDVDAHRLEAWEPELARELFRSLWALAQRKTSLVAVSDAQRIGARLARLSPLALT